MEVLIKYGADVDSVSDTGSTPVRSACYMTHLDIVHLLVANKADIQRPNHNGGTCLINSVQSVKLCKFLLENNAFVNALDIQNKTGRPDVIYQHTIHAGDYMFCNLQAWYIFDNFLSTALHYAIQEHRHETTQLLLRYNADPRIVSKYGDDALQTACLKVSIWV